MLLPLLIVERREAAFFANRNLQLGKYFSLTGEIFFPNRGFNLGGLKKVEFRV